MTHETIVWNGLTLQELGRLNNSLRGITYEHPELSGIVAMQQEAKQIIDNDPRFKIGETFREKAIEHGLDDGYAEPSDYYFAVVVEDIYDDLNLENRKHVNLLTCFKFEWWMNGEAYLEGVHGHTYRGFNQLFPESMQDKYYEEGEYTNDPDELRALLLKAGMEEKPELIPFYTAARQAKPELIPFYAAARQRST